MSENHAPAVVVTGASTGIGYAVAQTALKRGARVFGSVRKQGDAQRLASAFGPAFTPLLFDVTNQRAVSEAAARVAQSIGRGRLLGLVNNAGVAVPAPLLHQPIGDFRRQIETNLTGQLIVTQAFAGLLGADRSRTGNPGRIVMISSVNGRIGSPFLGAYSASKHALEGMSESLRRELMVYGIDVVIVGPGAVATPIWDKALELDLSPYKDTDYAEPAKKMRDYAAANKRQGLPAEKVGALVWEALTASRPKRRYAIVPSSFVNWTLPRLLPARMIDRIIARRLGFPGY